MRLAAERRAEFKALIADDPREALRQAVPMVARQQLPASIVELLEERVSGNGVLRAYLAGPDAVAGGVEPIVRVAELEGGRTYRAYVFGRRAETVTWVAGASLNGLVIDEKFAVNERPLRPLEIGEIPPASRPAVEVCPVSGKAAVVASKGEPITEATPAVEVRGEIVYFCDGAHIISYEQQIIYAEAGTGGPQRFTGILPAAPSPSLGQLRVLFIPMTYADQNQMPATEAKCYEIMKEVSDFFLKASFGRLTCMPTVTPPIKLPHDEAWYFQKDLTDGVSKEIDGLGLEHNHAREEARKLGYDANDFDTVVLRLSGGPGGNVSRGGGSGVWLFGDSVATCAHEIGHAFGLAHANYWDTGGTSAIGAGGNTEYGDQLDVMGNAGVQRGHYNAQAKNQIKWLPDAFVQTVTGSGLYRVYAFDQTVLDPDKRYALKVVKDNQRTYWGEVRVLYDGNNNWVANGMLLGWKWPGNSGNNIQLIDTTPGSPGGKNDAPIVVGETFSDFEAGIHITTVAVNTDVNGIRSADIVVNLGNPATNLPPALSLTASALNVPVNAPVTFTASASDPNGDSLAYQWLSSDNSSASTAITGPNAPGFTRSFTTAGQYVVTCIVSDRKGGSAVRYVLVTVGNGNSRYSISGRITLDVQKLPGVYVSTGANNAVLSDSDGYYTVPGLTNGTYTVAPLLYGYAFTELFNNSVLVGPNFTGGDFAAELAAHVAITASAPTAFEAGTVAGRFTLTRTGSDADPLDVKVVPVFGTASSGDYSLSPAPVSGSPYNTVTIPAGTNAIDILVTPVNDTTAEGPETVVMQLGLDAAYVIDGLATATVVIEDNDTALPKVSVVASSIAAFENPPQSSSFTITRTGPTTGDLTINLTYPGTASNGVDYVMLPAAVVIPAGASSTNLTVTPINDALSEDFETVIATIASSAAYLVDPNSTNNIVTIVDDDLQIVSLEVADAVATEVDLTPPGAAPDPGVFIVSRAGDISQPLKVYYAVSGYALHGVDYEPLPGSVTILAGQSRASVVITPHFDALGEGPETVVLQLAGGGGNYRLGLVNSGTVTINDAGDPPYVEVVPLTSAREPATAGKFRFTLKGSVPSNIVVNYTVSGTAVGGVDYTTLNGSVTINGTGTNTVSDVSVTPINNAVADELRTVTVTLTPSPDYRTWQATASATIWLYDDEQPTVFVDAHTTANNSLSTLSEGGATNKFYLSRTGSTAASLTVNYTLGGTAANGVDYQTLSGVAVIPAGLPGVDVVLTNINDAVFEGTETITLNLAPGAYSRGPGATMYLLDNESSSLRVGFATNSSVVSESAGTVNIPVKLSASSAAPVTVEYEVLSAGSATGPTNTAATGMPYWLRLTRTNDEFRTFYSANGSAWTQLGSALTNALANPLWIGLAVCSASDGNLATATFDNVTVAPDPGGAFVGRDVGFVSASGSVSQNGGVYTVTGSGALIGSSQDEFYFAAKEISSNFTFSARVATSSGNVTNRLAGLMAREDLRRFARHVTVAQRSTNTTLSFSRTNSTITALGAGVDFQFTPGILTFPPGVTSNAVPITIMNDSLSEPNEQIVLTLRHANGALLGLTNHVLAINDNDAAPLQPSVGFAATNSSVAEDGSPAVLVALSAPVANSVSVDYGVIGGSATSPDDFTLAPGTLTFAPGETVKALPLSLVDDLEVEPSETVIIGLSNVVGGALTTSSNHTLTILDNDLPVVTVTATDASAHESGDTGEWTFTRTGPSATNLVVTFTRTGTASAGTDYASFATSITILAGTNTATLTLTPGADALVEGNETVILTLAANSAYLVGSPNNATVTITDANIPTVTITASSPNASETGPTAGNFTITRVGPTNAALTVNFSVTGTATSGSDYTSIGTSAVIAAGQSNKVVTVTPLEDALTEGPEYVVVSLSNSANYVIGASSFANVTINDNDSPPTVFISQPSAKAVRLAPGNGLNLVAVAADDGAPNPLTYTWSKFSGPGAVTFGSPTSTNTTATFASNGLYTLRITVTDGQFTARDDVSVEVGGFALPEWMDANLGASSTRGKSGLNNGVFTVTGSGTGFSGTADAGHFVCRQVNGASSVYARVTSFAGTTTNAIAGVMLRERNFRGARRMLVGVRTNGVVELRVRTADNGTSTNTAVSTSALPMWFKIERSGDTVTAYWAPDVSGAPGAWVQVGSAATLTNLRADSELGIAASNGSLNTLADATFDNLTLTPAPAGPALISEDMGTTSLIGGSSVSNTTYTVQGGNSLSSDGGHYRFQQYVGDVTIVTRILSYTATTDSAKGGVMVRDTSLDAAPFGFMGMAYIRGGYFLRRNVPGGSTSSTLDNSPSTPYWLRVIRKGNAVTAWKASNTASNTPGTWVQRGPMQVFSADAPIYAGLAVDNISASALNTTVFDNLSIMPGNTAPVVNPGPGGFITGTNAISIIATVTDDGDPNPPGATTYQWSQVSGPGTVTFSNSSAVDTVATFSIPGTYLLRLTADDGEVSVFRDVTYVVATPYETWQTQHFPGGSSNPDAAEGADPDHDDLTNLAEYAYGTDPNALSVAPFTIEIVPQGGEAFFRIHVTRNPAATDVQFTVEWKSDLNTMSNWSGTGLVTEQNTAALLVVRDSTPVSSLTGRNYQVKVSKP